MDTKSLDKLYQSPIFQLSLSSKELFHSNFLYWISTISPEMFKYILTKLFERAEGSAHLDNWPDNYDVKREYNNFDLCVLKKSGKKESIWLVIENKVKSIPNILQVKEYSAKSPEAAHLLLSLSTNFPAKDAIIKESWSITDYEKLSNILKTCLEKNLFNLNPYQSNIISDYAVYVEILHKLQKEWQIDIAERFISPENLSYLRINDLQEKHRFSNLYTILKKQLEDRLKANIIENSSRTEIFSGRYTAKDKNVFIGWGMTRAQGLLEIKILVEENVILLVQIQGNQYRHCVELNNSMSAEDNWNFYSNKDPMTSWFISNSNSNRPFCPFKDSPALLDIRPDTTRHDKRYNQYGNSFLYKSIGIPCKTTIKEVLDMIVYDCENILNLLNQHE